MNLQNKLLVRYMLENDIENQLQIEYFNYEKWLNKLNKHNILFGQLMKYHNLLVDDKIIEICSDLEYNVLRNLIFRHTKEYFVTDYGIGPLQQNVPEGFLIANGVYNGISEWLLKNKVLNFVVGVCGDKKNCNIQTSIEYYKHLQKQLIKQGTKEIEVIEDCNKDTSIYMISRIDKSKQLKKSYEANVAWKRSSR